MRLLACIFILGLTLPAQTGLMRVQRRAATAGGISRIGSPTEIQSSLQDCTGSCPSITVPADATLLIIGVSGYGGVANMFSGYPPTIGGSTMTVVSTASDLSTSQSQAALFYKISPATGSQTLAWNWGTVVDQGAQIVYAFYKGVNTSSLVRDSDGVQNASTSTATKTLTASSGDLIVAFDGLFTSGTTSFSWTNATKVADFTLTGYRNSAASWAEGSPGGNVAVTCTHTDNDGGLAAIVLKPQ